MINDILFRVQLRNSPKSSEWVNLEEQPTPSKANWCTLGLSLTGSSFQTTDHCDHCLFSLLCVLGFPCFISSVAPTISESAILSLLLWVCIALGEICVMSTRPPFSSFSTSACGSGVILESLHLLLPESLTTVHKHPAVGHSRTLCPCWSLALG